MSTHKRRAQKDPPGVPLRRNDSDLSDRSEDSDGEVGQEQTAASLELPPTHDKRHPKHLENSTILESQATKFKQNYPFNRKAVPSLLSSESPFHNYRGFFHLAGLILVRIVSTLALILFPAFHLWFSMMIFYTTFEMALHNRFRRHFGHIDSKLVRSRSPEYLMFGFLHVVDCRYL